MTALPRMPPFSSACTACGGLIEREHPSDDGTQCAAADQVCDLAKLVAIGAHEEELVAHARAAVPDAECRY